MTKNERKEVQTTASNSGYKPSNYDCNVQINGNGDKIKHIGDNRTIVNGTTYYGSSNAKKAISGKK